MEVTRLGGVCRPWCFPGTGQSFQFAEGRLRAETIEAPQDRPWGARAAYLKGPGGLTVEIEQLLKRT